MHISGIHHVAIIASDYQRSKRFYTELLGLAIVAETYRAARDSYKLDLRTPDGVQIELFSFPAPPPRPSRPEACGLRHLAFRVPGAGCRRRRAGIARPGDRRGSHPHRRVHRQALYIFRRPRRPAA